MKDYKIFLNNNNAEVTVKTDGMFVEENILHFYINNDNGDKNIVASFREWLYVVRAKI